MSNFSPNNDISLEDGIQLYETKAHQALATLATKGFASPVIPQYNTDAGRVPYQGQVPTNLPDLNDNQLGYYMGLLSEWNQYVQCQLAEASVQLQKTKAILEHVEAKLKVAYARDEEDKKRSNPERDDLMRCDRRYIDSNSNVIYWETLYTHIRAIANAADQAFAAVSRRITQRGQSVDRDNRQGSITNHTNIPSGPVFRNRT